MKNTEKELQSNTETDYQKFYAENGYVIIRNQFSDSEVNAWKDEADRLLKASFVKKNNLRTPMVEMGSSTVVERIDPVIDVSPIFKSVLFDRRILGVLEEIFGEEAVLFKDKLIFKAPGMIGYDMHQDYAWWQPKEEDNTFKSIDADKILSVMLAIDEANEENGALQLFPGYHKSLISPVGELRNMSKEEIGQIDMSKRILVETQPGDIVIFHSLAPHCSEPNRSENSRRQLYMTYNAISCGDAYDGQQLHYRSYVKARMVNGGEVYFE